jgi:hypothetical protein
MSQDAALLAGAQPTTSLSGVLEAVAQRLQTRLSDAAAQTADGRCVCCVGCCWERLRRVQQSTSEHCSPGQCVCKLGSRWPQACTAAHDMRSAPVVCALVRAGR